MQCKRDDLTQRTFIPVHGRSVGTGCFCDTRCARAWVSSQYARGRFPMEQFNKHMASLAMADGGAAPCLETIAEYEARALAQRERRQANAVARGAVQAVAAAQPVSPHAAGILGAPLTSPAPVAGAKRAHGGAAPGEVHGVVRPVPARQLVALSAAVRPALAPPDAAAGLALAPGRSVPAAAAGAPPVPPPAVRVVPPSAAYAAQHAGAWVATYTRSGTAQSPHTLTQAYTLERFIRDCGHQTGMPMAARVHGNNVDIYPILWCDPAAVAASHTKVELALASNALGA